MGATQSIPVIGEVVTILDGAGRTVAAGACYAVGQKEAGKKLIDSAGQTFVDYTEKGAIAANINLGVAKWIQHDEEKVQRILQKQGEAWTQLGENTPGVGHIVGVARYATGDTEGGDRCMINASRTTAIILATAATGGGALVAGGVAVGAGLTYDAVATAAQSAVKGEYKPVGYIDGITTAVKSGDARDVYNAFAAPVADFGAGMLAGRSKASLSRIKSEGTAAAALAADRVTRGSPVGFEIKLEVPGGRPQLPFTEVAHAVKIAPTTKAAMQMLHEQVTASQQQMMAFDFVRRPNGEYRFISHSDASVISRQRGTAVGHTSLVEPGGGVVAAGEMYVGKDGIIHNINSLSGHFLLSLRRIKAQMGPAWPASRFANIRPKPFMGFMVDRLALPWRLGRFTAYAWLVTEHRLDSISSASHHVGAHVTDHTETAAFTSEEKAREFYTDLPLDSKVLIKADGTVLEKSNGPQQDTVMSWLKDDDREEPLKFEDNHLAMALFVPFLDCDQEDDLTSVGVKRYDLIDWYVGRVTANDMKTLLPCAIYPNATPKVRAYWKGEKVTQTQESPEVLTNGRNMRWVHVSQLTSGGDQPVNIGVDEDANKGIFAVRANTPAGTLLGRWMSGQENAVLYDAAGETNAREFEVLCWDN
ncbi:hypothetical protein BDW22DRAFT_1353036 [Trametopsis cervina]|nr:hypothetical protein BDW22DRAFT_1353036 [Trametopsis cervina]